jgi:hypothetical protein
MEQCFMTLMKDGCIAGRSCLLTAFCFARQEEVEARDQGQLDDLLQLHRQSHEKERDEGIRLHSLELFIFYFRYKKNTTDKKNRKKFFFVTPSYVIPKTLRCKYQMTCIFRHPSKYSWQFSTGEFISDTGRGSYFKSSYRMHSIAQSHYRLLYHWPFKKDQYDQPHDMLSRPMPKMEQEIM